MKRLSGFSLMEMMTVLLIVSVVAAASAPMINKRMMVNQGAGNCPWERLGDGSIFYNQDADDISVIIGANGINNNNDLNPKLHIRTNNNNPFITFQQGANNQLALRYRENTLGLSNIDPGNGATAVGVIAGADENSTVIGNGAGATSNATALGRSALANERCIAIGNGTIAVASDSIAIGSQSGNNITQALGRNSISIGSSATAISDRSIAFGLSARARGGESIAIGENAEASGGSSIAIGSDNDNGIATKATGGCSLAIGDVAEATNDQATAVGPWAKATGLASIAIGEGATATNTRSVAIGAQANAGGHDQIVLGTPTSTVYIPGKLVVDKDVLLNAQSGTLVMRSLESRGSGYYAHREYINHSAVNNYSGLSFLKSEDYWGQDDNLADYQWVQTQGSVTPWFTDEQLNFFNSYINFNTNINSDRRLKNVGKAFTSGLAEIKKLEVFNYTFKKDESKTPRVGVMAQDLQKIFPNAVTKGEDGFLRIRMEDMFYAVVNAVKELDNKFDLLAQKQKKIDELEAKLDKLEKRLEKLEKQK